MQRQLTDTQVREVLARAEEIYLGGSVTSDSVLQAAEEAGLPRDAVEQALRERFQTLERAPEQGHLVFAKAGDQCYYAARVVETSGNRVTVEFLAGGKNALPLEDLRDANFAPGLKLMCNWPGYGWCPAKVTNYDADGGTVTVRGWANSVALPISEVRLEPSRAERRKSHRRALVLTYLFGLLSGGGGLALLNWLLNR